MMMNRKLVWNGNHVDGRAISRYAVRIKGWSDRSHLAELVEYSDGTYHYQLNADDVTTHTMITIDHTGYVIRHDYRKSDWQEHRTEWQGGAVAVSWSVL